ncbi:ThiF family adenylyltransferase [Peribacillus frigoritolerans]|uniref:ThiF family adenylyltransferase n=1 Tax=Peribacillus frigoritolerans TaxID=450367 RepID=UPI0032B41643
MDENLYTVKAELAELGFHFLDNHIAIGHVPQTGNINNHVIQVEINLDCYPIKQPSIKLTRINGEEDLYQSMPIKWRHVDEIVASNPKQSEFYICCLHNWSAKREQNGFFIYSRILSWLESNVKQEWKLEEDLPTWRILPQFSNSVLYLPEFFLKQGEKVESKTMFKMDLYHQPFTFKNKTKASTNKRGDLYPYKEINYQESYTFFPEISEEKEFNKLKSLILGEKHSKSTLFFTRIPRYTEFKTFYQLLNYLRINNLFREISKDIKNVVLMVMYMGDSGRMEATAVILGREFIERKEELVGLTVLKIESMADRGKAVDLTIGLIGVGSLGSQIARLLVEKDVDRLILSDKDKMSLENLGRHVLGSFHVGNYKSFALSNFLSILYLKEGISATFDDDETAKHSDLLVVTVGDSQAYDRLAFQKFLNYDKPIIWAWTSPNNILQEIVITTKLTGCLNCYYEKINQDVQLNRLQEIARKEIQKQPSSEFDACGNPHTISRMERMVFFATQIVSLISYYSKNKNFKFDYVNYYWGIDDIIPTPLLGHLERNKSCFCN